MGKASYTDILLEEMNGKFDRILEIVQGNTEALARKVEYSDLEPIYRRLDLIEHSLKIITPLVYDHERRIATLEKST